ncbi:ribonuclease HII [Ureaplasma miroungigenitalium]|uniref:Ribonuclease n=1 Tax=Ureaplasma miroungigenitalium TaxID=1042321 RepID=A0ABT3BNC6_9BACT|nr:ribonuclease HII [Ureaplasma miroungigenitalium]MCV3728517.1 ribonuclease HII [Ureaplasma miroungigenitalium]MCV3734518.1 ribonuclease HII [Ureaplasma miroungigenitalium]
MLDFEKQYWTDHPIILGVDEVGRGCCAGPLVVCAVILPQNYTHPQIVDSKRLTPKQRAELFTIIQRDALFYHYEFISAQEVDALNPKKASQIGMQRCVIALAQKIKIDLVLTDFEPIQTNIPQINLIHGDNLSISIAAASIMAKVIRDNYMIDLHTTYPAYGFDQHKGYVTQKHIQAIKEHGVISDVHRMSYKNVQACLVKQPMSK